MSTNNSEVDGVAEMRTARSPAPELGPRATKTINRILDATRTVFLTKGYAGTTIDEIARVAGISRASFYTYFATKRDVLLALGADSASLAEELVARYLDRPEPVTRADLRRFVDDNFELLDVHGAFAINWTLAALEDEEIRSAGMRRHLRMCEQFGRLVSPAEGGGTTVMRGLAVYAMIERGWRFTRLYGDDLDLDAFKDEIADLLYCRTVGPTPPDSRRKRRTGLVR